METRWRTDGERERKEEERMTRKEREKMGKEKDLRPELINLNTNKTRIVWTRPDQISLDTDDEIRSRTD